MGVRLTNTFLTITGFSLTNEDTNYPKENAVNRASPQLQTRSTTTGDTRYVIDLGATQTSIEVYLDYVNFSSFKFQESADGSTNWTDIGSLVTVSPDDVQGVYRYKAAITMASKRYLGIYIPSQTPVDGVSYFRIGTVAVPTSITELPVDTLVGYPFSMNLTDEHVIENEFASGAKESVLIGNIDPMLISFSLDTVVDDPNIVGTRIKQITDLFRNKTTTVYLDFNLNQTWQAYLVKREGAIATQIDTPNLGTVNFGTQVMRVIV